MISSQPASTNTMEQPNNMETPYHTKFFDVITIPAPIPPLSPQIIDTTGGRNHLQKYNSIMFYEDAILDTVKDLKDGHNGSSVTAIKKHVKANFLHDDYKEPEPDMPLPVEHSAFLLWKDTLFVQALKSLVRQQSLTHSTCIKNGSTFYKLSPGYKQHRTKELNDRLEQFERYKALQQKKKQELSKRKEAPIRKKWKKGHLVEAKTVTIVDKYQKSNMDLDLEKQRQKRFVLPRQELGLRADDYADVNNSKTGTGRAHRGLRENLKIPHTKILVKEV